MGQRLIFHVDVNSAYLSWEAAKRMAEGKEDIRRIPSAIGGDRDKRTGIILAKSIPAKQYGIRTGEPVSMALRKCPDLFLIKADFRLYSKNSRAFLEICRRFAPIVEQFSIDECFLDMSGTSAVYSDPVTAAKRLKQTIREELNFTVNIGIGPNKLLAKMASDFEKPDRVHTLFAEEISEKMWPLPVGDLFSVGRATAEKLNKHGIHTIGELANRSLFDVQNIVGFKFGKQIHDYANGISFSPVAAVSEDAKGYSNSVTLENDVVTKEDAYRVLLALADSVASRMRLDGARASCISVTIRTNDFKNYSHQRKLSESTDVTNEIYENACRLFDELWKNNIPLRLLGIALTDLDRGGTYQLSLFEDEKKEKLKKMDKTLDHIRAKYGSGSITRGSIYRSLLQVGKKYRALEEEKRNNREEKP